MFGLSTAPFGYDYRPEAHARVVATFVDLLGLRSFTPVMQDGGGPIVLRGAGHAI